MRPVPISVLSCSPRLTRIPPIKNSGASLYIYIHLSRALSLSLSLSRARAREHALLLSYYFLLSYYVAPFVLLLPFVLLCLSVCPIISLAPLRNSVQMTHHVDQRAEDDAIRRVCSRHCYVLIRHRGPPRHDIRSQVVWLPVNLASPCTVQFHVS